MIKIKKDTKHHLYPFIHDNKTYLVLVSVIYLYNNNKIKNIKFKTKLIDTINDLPSKPYSSFEASNFYKKATNDICSQLYEKYKWSINIKAPYEYNKYGSFHINATPYLFRGNTEVLADTYKGVKFYIHNNNLYCINYTDDYKRKTKIC